MEWKKKFRLKSFKKIEGKVVNAASDAAERTGKRRGPADGLNGRWLGELLRVDALKKGGWESGFVEVDDRLGDFAPGNSGVPFGQNRCHLLRVACGDRRVFLK